jgi:hypothetical protein
MNAAAKIDSFGISIPLDKTALTKDQLTNLIIDKSSGELLREAPKKLKDSFNGISTLISLERYDLRYYKGDFLNIGINAKQLGRDYFQGINSDNINKILSYLNKRFMLNISLKDLLRSKVRDIDICKDSTLCEVSKMHLIVKEVYNLSKQLGINSNNVNRFRNNYTSFVGIQYSHRKGATKNLPFVKWYHKGYDLITQSNEFATNYLPTNDASELAVYNNLVRVECTTKKADIKREFGNDTLMSVLSCNAEQIFKNKLDTYFGAKDKLKRVVMNKRELKASELKTLALINALHSLGKNLDEIIKLSAEPIREFGCKKTYRRYKNEIQKLYDIFILNDTESSIKNLYKHLGF